jgi:hypothetical protein
VTAASTAVEIACAALLDLFYKTIGMPQLAAPLAEVIGEDD